MIDWLSAISAKDEQFQVKVDDSLRSESEKGWDVLASYVYTVIGRYME